MEMPACSLSPLPPFTLFSSFSLSHSLSLSPLPSILKYRVVATPEEEPLAEERKRERERKRGDQSNKGEMNLHKARKNFLMGWVGGSEEGGEGGGGYDETHPSSLTSALLSISTLVQI